MTKDDKLKSALNNRLGDDTDTSSRDASPSRNQVRFGDSDEEINTSQRNNPGANPGDIGFLPPTIPQLPQGYYPIYIPQPASSSIERSLPKWKLSQYSGDPLDWPEWSGMFKATVNKSNITDDEKMNHLKTLVVGKAKEVVAGFGYSGKYYQAAWNKLEKTFGKPHIIAGSQLSKIQNLPTVKIHDSEAIVKFSRSVAACIEVLDSMGYESDLKSSTNVEIVLRKLPPNLREKWHHHVERLRVSQPSLILLNNWLEKEATVHEEMIALNSKVFNGNRGNSTKTKQQGFNAVAGKGSKPTGNCPICSTKHPLWACTAFKQLTIKDRNDKVKQFKLCFLCFKDDHTVKECKLKECGIDGCTKKHNRLLHFKNQTSNPNNIATGSVQTNSGTENLSCEATLKKYGALPIYQIDVKNNGLCIRTWALADTGASMSWIDRTVADKLRLKGKKHEFMVNGIHGGENMKSSIVKASVIPIHHNKQTHYKNEIESEYQVEFATHKNLTIGSNVYKLDEIKKQFKYLNEVPYREIDLSKVKVILGQDCFDIIKPLEYKSGEVSSPCAIRSYLGWTIAGPLPRTSNEVE